MGWLEWLQGKKTYIIFILATVFNAGVLFGWWPVESQLWSIINAILGFLGLGALSAKGNRMLEK